MNWNRTIAVAFTAALAPLGWSQQTQQSVPLQITTVPGITSSSTCIDNRSINRQNVSHTFFASGTGTWSVQIQYSTTSCVGPWTSYGSLGLVSNATAVPIGYGFDGPNYKPYISFAITGSVTITYTGEKQLYFPSATSGGVSFPILVNSGGTGLTSVAQYGILYGNSSTALGVAAAGTANQVFIVPSGGNPPAFGAVNLASPAAVTGGLGVTNGGTGATSASAGFNNLSPMTTLGDTIYGGASGAGTRLAGDTSNTRKFLRELSVGGVAQAPVWDVLQTGDLPTFPTVGTPGTYTKVTTDAYGRVTAGVQAQFTDIGGTISLTQLPNTGTAGTYTKVTTDAQGLVTAGTQANFTDLAGSLQLSQTPLLTSQDILYYNGTTLSNLPILTVANGDCLGNSGGIWSDLPCAGGSGSGTMINDVPLTAPGLVVANGGVHATLGALTGDLSTSGLTATLATTGVGAGSCGDATHSCGLIYDAKGRLLTATNNTITGATNNWLTISNAPLYDIRVYNWTAQSPSGTLTATNAATVTLTPGPAGVNGGATANYVYIAGTGTPEAVLLTGGTCNGTAVTSCTVTFTPANNHSAGWTIGPASGGLQEVINAAFTVSGIVLMTTSPTIHGQVTVPSGGRLSIMTGTQTQEMSRASDYPNGILLYAYATYISLNGLQMYNYVAGQTSGTGFECDRAYCYTDHLAVTGGNIGVLIDQVSIYQSYGYIWTGLGSVTGNAYQIQASNGATASNVQLTADQIFANTGSACYYITQVDGMQVANSSCGGGAYGVRLSVINSGLAYAANTSFDNVGLNGTTAGFLLEGASGTNIFDIFFKNSGVDNLGTSSGVGVSIAANGTTKYNQIQLQNNQIIGANQQGVIIGASTTTSTANMFTGNQVIDNNSSNTAGISGVQVNNGISGWLVASNVVKNASTNGHQAYGISNPSGCLGADIHILANDLSGNATGSINLPCFTSNWTIAANNEGVSGGGGIWAANCTGTATASATLYIAMHPPGACTNTTAGTVSEISAPTGGFIRNLRVNAGTGGVNSSDGVVTLYVNGSASTLTCTLGTGTTCSDNAHIFAYGAGQTIRAQVVTQSGTTLANLEVSWDM